MQIELTQRGPLPRLRLHEENDIDANARRVRRMGLTRRNDRTGVLRPILAFTRPESDAELRAERDLDGAVRMHRRQASCLTCTNFESSLVCNPRPPASAFRASASCPEATSSWSLIPSSCASA